MEKIVYLLGAGASKAEMDFEGLPSDISMEAIGRKVYVKSKEGIGKYAALADKFGFSPDLDIEYTISLFEDIANLGEKNLEEIFNELRSLFRQCLIEEISNKKIEPKILYGLLHLHKNYENDVGPNGEKLLGILTTNYDSFCDESYSKVYGAINCSYDFTSKDYKYGNNIPPLIKLHGSFNWKIKDKKLEISKSFEKLEHRDDFTGWIPPSVYKRPSKDIFPTLWNKANTLLKKCDILRVIGSNLRNEDFALISLLFISQIESVTPCRIEMVIPEKNITGSEEEPKEGIMQRLPFLTNIMPLSALPLQLLEEKETIHDIKNVFYRWLLKKIKEAEQRNHSVSEDVFINELDLWR